MQNDNAARQIRAGAVRRADIEAYTALRWVGVLFKAAAVFLGVALLAEIIAGLNLEGWASLPTLLGEAARTVVLAVVLWGGGDLVRLLIHLGHDVRAERMLLSRIAHRMNSSEQLPELGSSGPATYLRADAERTVVESDRGEPIEPEIIEPAETAPEEPVRPEEGREAA